MVRIVRVTGNEFKLVAVETVKTSRASVVATSSLFVARAARNVDSDTDVFVVVDHADRRHKIDVDIGREVDELLVHVVFDVECTS